MVNIQFDTAVLTNDLLLSQDQVNELMDFAVKEVTVAFKESWEQTAARELGSMRAKYIANLNIIDEGYGKGAVVLTGQDVNMVEQGTPEFDMKGNLLSGPNAKVGKNGARYNTIPFTFGVPTSKAENFSNILPQEVYNVVKKQPVNKPVVKDQLPTQFQQPGKSTRPATSKFQEYKHKHAIHEGIIKQQDTVTKQNSYHSFRRVSDNSDPNSWIYPAKDGKNLADKTLAEFDVPTELGRAIDNYMTSIGRG